MVASVSQMVERWLVPLLDLARQHRALCDWATTWHNFSNDSKSAGPPESSVEIPTGAVGEGADITCAEGQNMAPKIIAMRGALRFKSTASGDN